VAPQAVMEAIEANQRLGFLRIAPGDGPPAYEVVP